uniref:HAT C-terminal dimerisation domain-containing protein n=1 Tax=Amphimedon queenslandica TaxID=400682 RepID=A0A1X7TLT9_AMPQE
MATTMASESFVLSLGAMYDSLEELASNCQSIYKKEILRYLELIPLWSYKFECFLSMIDYPGINYREIKSAIEGGKEVPVSVNKFIGVVVTNNRKSDVQIQYEQFMQSLATNLEKKINDLDCPFTYGQEDVVFLCDLFHLNEFEVTTKRGLSEYIDIIKETGLTAGRKPPEALSPLINAINTMVTSSADCERGFSQMNILATPVRSSLNLKTLSSLIFIKIVGPPPIHFDPSPYTRKWTLLVGR